MLPQSPRWLYAHKSIEAVKHTLSKICYTDTEMQETLHGLITQGLASGTSGGWGLLTHRGYRLPVIVAISIAILNQLTGDNVLLQFNATILGTSGVQGALVASTYVGVTHLVMTAVALVLVDRVGRRPLLLVGTVGLVVSLVLIGLSHSPVAISPSMKAYGTLTGLITFQVFYAVGPGVVVWLAVSEILPTAVRARGMSIALFGGSLAASALAAVFMSAANAIGYSGVFFALAACCVLYFLVAVFLLPEAKGRSLEEVEATLLRSA